MRRSGRCRQGLVSPHLFRDVRQLVVRGLLQGNRSSLSIALQARTDLVPPQKEAVHYSWELLTGVYKLPKDRLYVTYFEGDAKNGLEPDLEVREYWMKQGVLEDHILPGNAKDNFWGALSFGTPDASPYHILRRNG